MSLKNVFVINLIIGSFLVLTHAPPVALKFSGHPNFESISLWSLIPILLLGWVLLLGAITALVGKDPKMRVWLPIHAVALVGLSVESLSTLGWLLFFGFSVGNFGWTLGTGAAVVGYSVYLLVKAFYEGENKLVYNAGWYSAGFVFLLELGLVYRFYTYLT